MSIGLSFIILSFLFIWLFCELLVSLSYKWYKAAIFEFCIIVLIGTYCFIGFNVSDKTIEMSDAYITQEYKIFDETLFRTHKNLSVKSIK